jgi:two-component system, OmpR family, response regulator
MKARLLVVDDEPLIVDLLNEGLQEEGYEVICATGGQEALMLSRRNPIDLAILDYSLPDVYGAGLFKDLRAGNPNLPVIFLTGHPNLSTAVDLMKCGARDYLTKPFSLDQLALRIAAILQTSGTPSLPANRPGTAAQPSGAARPAGQYIFGNSQVMLAVDAQIQISPAIPTPPC